MSSLCWQRPANLRAPVVAGSGVARKVEARNEHYLARDATMGNGARCEGAFACKVKAWPNGRAPSYGVCGGLFGEQLIRVFQKFPGPAEMAFGRGGIFGEEVAQRGMPFL